MRVGLLHRIEAESSERAACVRSMAQSPLECLQERIE
jgi:hypothetical protein